MDWSTVKHFSRSEFGRSGSIEPDEKLVRLLDQAREIAGVPFAINSGIRSVERNAKAGGAPESAHLSGHAVDIHCPTSRHRFLIVRALIEVGFYRIGIGATFVHADTDPDKGQEVIWTY